MTISSPIIRQNNLSAWGATSSLHAVGPARPGPVRRNFLFFYYFQKWLKTILAPNKTKLMNWVQGCNGNSPYISNYLIGVCQCVCRTRQADFRLPPCSGGACGLLRWPEIVSRRPDRSAATWPSSRGGACHHHMPVDAAEAG